MNGLGFREHGGPEEVRVLDFPEPVVEPGTVRVRVRAAAFNHLDLFVLAGIPGVPIERPHILGSDAAGTVESTGEGADGFRPGARVLLNPGLYDGTCEACRAGIECLCRNFRILGEHTQGSATRFVVVPARNVHPLPEKLDFDQGAAAPLVFQTAWRALVTVGGLRSGESVAVIGAGGGVATAAIQIARNAGARVAVVSRSKAKAERALSLGAETALVPTDAAPMDRQLWEWTGKRGVDLIFDSVGAPTLSRSVKSLARGGRLVVIGATGGATIELDLRPIFWRQASIRGSTMATASEFLAVLRELAEGRLHPVIDRVFSWEDAPLAFRRLGDPDLFGKVVVRGPPDASD